MTGPCRLSIVIPTYNRLKKLENCLKSIDRQGLPREAFEIVIVDDGSTDDTPAFLEELVKSHPSGVKVLPQKNRGPAAARNNGISHARGEVIWITGDDYILETDCLRQHLNWQEEKYPGENTVVFGYATWHPDLEITDIMHWVENGGLQFYYHKIEHDTEISFYNFITCNISFKKSFFEKHGPFDENYLYAMGEDTDLGIRFAKGGMQFRYNARAIVYHDHPITEEDSKRRTLCCGETIALQEHLWPGYWKKPFPPSRHEMHLAQLLIAWDERTRYWFSKLPQSLRRRYLKPIFSAYDFLLLNDGLHIGFENQFRRHLALPTSECILIFSRCTLDFFYRKLDTVKRDYPDHSIILVDSPSVETEAKLGHPFISWFIMQPDNRPIQNRCARQIKQLPCTTAVLIEERFGCDWRTAFTLRRLGIKKVVIYNRIHDQLELRGRSYFECFCRNSLGLSTIIPSTVMSIIRSISTFFWTILKLGVDLIRWIFKKIFYRSDLQKQANRPS